MHAARRYGASEVARRERAMDGDAVPAGFVRLSVGCEPVEELWKAIETSLNKISG